MNKRKAAELVIANKELSNEEKEKRAVIASNEALKEMKLSSSPTKSFKLFNQNPASMAIRISDNMMLNANNSFRII
jgi:hypothetical protein